MFAIRIFVLTFLTIAASAKEEKTHNILMDPKVFPEYRTHGIKIAVSINEWMEVTCPQYDQAYPEDEMELFHLYALEDKNAYDQCIFKANKSVILACDSPHKTTTLTVKFQTWSPYPLGFVFEHGRTYYYMAVPKGETDCRNAIRLEVRIRDKESEVLVPPIVQLTKKTPKTISSTTTQKTTTTATTRRSKFRSTTKKNVAGDPSAQVGETGDGGNSASSARNIMFLTCLLSLLSLWINA